MIQVSFAYRGKNSEGSQWRMQIQLLEQDGLGRKGRVEEIRGADLYCIITDLTPKHVVLWAIWSVGVYACKFPLQTNWCLKQWNFWFASVMTIKTFSVIRDRDYSGRKLQQGVSPKHLHRSPRQMSKWDSLKWCHAHQLPQTAGTGELFVRCRGFHMATAGRGLGF